MNEKKYLVIFAILTIVILFGGVYVLSSSTSPSTTVTVTSHAQADTVDPTSFDWGKIQYSGPKATKTFTIKNSGKDTLKFYNIKTSCHCTNAYMTIDGKESPTFGMSGLSSWIGEVKPGGDAKLTVIFDQAFHGPQGIGPVTRFVSVETNDKGNQKLTFTLTGVVEK